MAKPWIKSWVTSLNKPKIMRLPPDQFKCWQILQWIAGEHDRDGDLPPVDECAFIMHIDRDKMQELIDVLVERRLVDLRDDTYALHDWDVWQSRKPSDEPEAVNARVRKHREAMKRDVTERNALQNVSDNVTPRNARNALQNERENENERERERETAAPNARARATRTRATRIPDDWIAENGPELIAYGAERGIARDATVEHFTEYHTYWSQAVDNATSYDWNKRWRLKFDKDVRGGKVGAIGHNGMLSERDAQYERAGREAAALIARRRGESNGDTGNGAGMSEIARKMLPPEAE